MTISYINLSILLISFTISISSILSSTEMEPQPTSEILHDFSPRFIVYKNGTIKRLREDVILPPSYDPDTQVHSKDVTISPGVSARLYRPDNIPEDTKIPVLIYIHGGAYCQYSAFSKMYHHYLNLLVSKGNVIGVSVDYRLAPESPMPACYDDAWAVTEWVLSSSSTHSSSDPWITQWGDLGRVFIAGDSSGGNMAHAMLARAGPSGLLGLCVKIEGAVLVHPFFGDAGADELIEYLSEGRMDNNDPRISPARDTARMEREVVCERVLVCVDKDDPLRGTGVNYYKVLKGSGWEGEVELLETNGGGHVFHLWDDNRSQKSLQFLSKVVAFINKSKGQQYLP